MRTQPLNNRIETSEIQTPITVRNLIEKFKKFKADTTAGPNQETPPKKERNTARICEIV